MSEKPGAELITIQQAADALGLKPPTLRAWMSRRKIGFVRLGNRAVRIPKSEISRLIEVGFTPARQ